MQMAKNVLGLKILCFILGSIDLLQSNLDNFQLLLICLIEQK